MKKLYVNLLFAVISLLSFVAGAVTVTVSVDSPERVNISINSEVKNVVQGNNVFDVTDNTSIEISTTEGNYLESVIKDKTPEQITGMNKCYLYLSVAADYEGAVWTVKSFNADEKRDAACTIVVDDASKVRVSRYNTNSVVELKNGANTVKYISDKELPLTITPVDDHNTTLYSVKLNGTEVAGSGNVWSVSPESGNTIDIAATFPSVDVPVKFTYSSDDVKDCITVAVDGVNVTNFNDGNFTVKMGQKVVLSGNTTEYNIETVKVNGNDVNFYMSYSFFAIGEEITIDVKAIKYAPVKVFLTLDDPENVNVYRGYKSANDVIAGLVAGKNTIELNYIDPIVSIEAKEGCNITSVMINGVDYKDSEFITATEGMEIVVTSEKIELANSFVVWIDDVNAAMYYYVRNSSGMINLSSGYNTVSFGEPEQYMVYGMGNSYSNIYKNDAKFTDRYFTPANGDIIKMFFTCNPSTCNVTFTGDAETEQVSVKRDIIKVIDNWKSGFSTLQGTQVDIYASEDYPILVLVDGTAVEKNSEGVYSFVVNKDVTVNVDFDELSGVENVASDNLQKDNNVYNMQGVLVVKNATEEQLSSLQAGLYIINGKKIIIRR